MHAVLAARAVADDPPITRRLAVCVTMIVTRAGRDKVTHAVRRPGAFDGVVPDKGSGHGDPRRLPKNTCKCRRFECRSGVDFCRWQRLRRQHAGVDPAALQCRRQRFGRRQRRASEPRRHRRIGVCSSQQRRRPVVFHPVQLWHEYARCNAATQRGQHRRQPRVIERHALIGRGCGGRRINDSEDHAQRHDRRLAAGVAMTQQHVLNRRQRGRLFERPGTPVVAFEYQHGYAPHRLTPQRQQTPGVNQQQQRPDQRHQPQ